MSIVFDNSITGIFKKEIKNRFRSEVLIDESIEMCYVQSSSRLDNYVSLKNKTVVLRNIDEPNKLKYSVLAKPYYKDYILLVPMMANQIIYSELSKRIFSILGYRKDAILEHTVEGYKADIYLPRQKKIIEIKALISDKKEGNIFPTVHSDRTIEQLDLFKQMLQSNMKCDFIIVSFNPYFDSVRINTQTIFYEKMAECMKLGMNVYAFSISCLNGNIHIKKKINIEYL